jgi:hypothetical protein
MLIFVQQEVQEALLTSCSALRLKPTGFVPDLGAHF